MQYQSNCCGEPVLSPDLNGHGKCSDCKENCVGLPECEECLGFHEYQDSCDGEAINGKMD